MTKRADQPITPGIKPDPLWSGSQDEMVALLDGCDFNAVRGKRIPPADFKLVISAAEKYQETHPEVQDRQAVTMACTAYWKLLEEMK